MISSIILYESAFSTAGRFNVTVAHPFACTVDTSSADAEAATGGRADDGSLADADDGDTKDITRDDSVSTFATGRK